MKQHTHIAIDLKSFYASVECRERGLSDDPHGLHYGKDQIFKGRGDNIGITWRDMETFFRYGNKIRGFHYKKRPLFYYVIMLF